MLSKAQSRAYLKRIGIDSPQPVNFASLNTLHQAHLARVPFENLDIALGRTITLSQDAILEKIVAEGRGGFCYELNFAFSLLLSSLGYQVNLLSARVFNCESYGPAFDHMLLQVSAQGSTWIADVGFGDCFRTPLNLDGTKVRALKTAYKVWRGTKGEFFLMQKKASQDWTPQYQFTLQPYVISDFKAMCHYQQTSLESPFTKKSICSIATDSGRKTITNGNLIITQDSERIERTITTTADYRSFLHEHFQLMLPSETDLSKLFPSNSVPLQQAGEGR